MKLFPKVIKFAIAHKFSKNRRKRKLKRGLGRQIVKHPLVGSKIIYRASRIKFRNKFLRWRNPRKFPGIFL